MERLSDLWEKFSLSESENRRAERELREIIEAQVPTIVFLSKTWSSKSRMERIKNTLEFDGLFTIPSDRRGGGLALMWKGRDMV